MRDRLDALALRIADTFPMRCVDRFASIDGRNRGLVIGGQAFTTVVPLLILTAGASGGGSAGDTFVERFRLSGTSAQAMRELFNRPPAGAGAMSLASLVVLLFSLLSLTRSLQSTYEAAWGLSPRGIPGTVHGLTGMSLLIAQLTVLTLLASALRGVPAATFIAGALRFVVAIPLWMLLQYLLLSRRIPLRALVPGSVAAAAGQVLLSLYSALWMPGVVASNAERYGLIGVTFALVSWLIVIGLAVVAGGVVAAELARARGLAAVPEPVLRMGRARTRPTAAAPAGGATGETPELVVLGFPNKERAEQAMAVAADLQRQELLDLEDAALVWRTPDGKIKVQQPVSTAGTGAATGALWGTLLGSLFLMPVFGLVTGAAAGALAGRLSDVGIDDSFIKEVAATLEPGTAAVFALVRRSEPDKVAAALAEFQPTVVRTSLTKDKEGLAATLGGT
jgi:uncharacterized membrane protein/uncharacterized BrkB/YihY/UPF0761 family membrane protein